jgi:hypothetical protein
MSDIKIQQIEAALRNYHYELDTRQHGGAAQNRAFNLIEDIMDIHWRQGKEFNRRKEAERGKE